MSDSDKKNKSGNSKTDNEIRDNKDAARRKLLKAGGVVASSALIPEKWSRPVVDNVLLPAHAQTSALLIGPVLVSGGALTPTQPAPAMMAQAGSSILDSVVNPAHAGLVPVPAPTSPPTPSPTSPPTPSPTSPPTPSPTSPPTPSPTSPPTPSPTSPPTPSPAAPTPAPTSPGGCLADGQCIQVAPPDSNNKVQVTITNVGTALLDVTGGGLTYQGVLPGNINVMGFFTDQTYSNTQGTLSNASCDGYTYMATLGGICNPVL